MDYISILWFVSVISSVFWMISGFNSENLSINTTQQQRLANTFATASLRGRVKKPPNEFLNKEAKFPLSSGRIMEVQHNTQGKSPHASSLSALLATVVRQELSDCRLVLIYDASDLHSVVVQDLLLLLPNPKQVGVACSSLLYSHEGNVIGSIFQ